MDERWDTFNLVPFRNENGVFFTSKDVREWEHWGYSYEDTSTITNHAQLVSRIHALYSDDRHTAPVELFHGAGFSMEVDTTMEAEEAEEAETTMEDETTMEAGEADTTMEVDTKPSSDMISSPDVPKFAPPTPDYVFSCSYPT